MEATTLQATIPQYNSLDMPMEVFRYAIVDNVIDKIEDFNQICLDYTEAIGGRELVQKLEDLQEIELLKRKVAIADCGTELLRVKPSKMVFDRMLELEYQSSVREFNVDTVGKYLEQIHGWVELDRIDLQILQNANKQSPTAGKYTHDYFAQMYVSMGIAFKMSIVEKDLSVRIYCAYVKRYKEYLKQQEK